MSASPRITNWGFRVLNLVHRTAVRASGGRLGWRAYGLDMVELVTTGRRTGQSHSTMLLVPLRVGTDLVVVASKGGDQRDPDWFKNLVADPRVRVTIRGESIDMLARVATPEEHALWWPRVVARYHHYEDYQRRAARLVPLVICSPGERASVVP